MTGGIPNNLDSLYASDSRCRWQPEIYRLLIVGSLIIAVAAASKLSWNFVLTLFAIDFAVRALRNGKGGRRGLRWLVAAGYLGLAASFAAVAAGIDTDFMIAPLLTSAAAIIVGRLLLRWNSSTGSPGAQT